MFLSSDRLLIGVIYAAPEIDGTNQSDASSALKPTLVPLQ